MNSSSLTENSRNKESLAWSLCRNLAVLMLVGFLLRIVAGQFVNGGLNIDYQGDEGDYAKAGHPSPSRKGIYTITMAYQRRVILQDCLYCWQLLSA